MNASSRLAVPSMRDHVSAEEWQTRCDLAACYRLVAHFGWSDLVFTHITARVPGKPGEYLINPYGMLFHEITASALIKIDAQGNALQESPFAVNPAGFLIHSAVHSARHDAQCVIHVHTLNGVAVSAQKQGLLPLSQQSMFVLASLAYHDYEGVAINEGERARLSADLGGKTFLMLRNHGLLTLGPSIGDAFLAMYTFEAACAIQVRAMSGGAALLPIAAELVATAQHQASVVTKSLGGQLVWPGLLRLARTLDMSYES